ncbi:helix-turn-helix domain-containing protein [Microbacterium sp. NPDC089180]|uniref:helix-turn-helix domain-containing protein n=1 Tax=unclassified Microbacterium TaxID=2609290 RepID=UPI00342504CA
MGEFQPRVKRGWNHLNTDQQAAVVTRYSNGETSTALAEKYGVAKSTILRILREARVVVRRQPLTHDQVREAARLYESGLSLSQVAKRLDVNQETMRTAILKAGVVLREPTRANPHKCTHRAHAPQLS